MTTPEPMATNRNGLARERALPVDVTELTDPDGDALTLTMHAGGIWLTSTTEADEVTVGPFPAGSLRDALTAIDAFTRVA